VNRAPRERDPAGLGQGGRPRSREATERVISDRRPGVRLEHPFCTSGPRRPFCKLRQLAGDGNLSDAIRELTHAQYTARLYAQAARDAERLRNDPADLAETKGLNEELDEISAW
jgi:hypothetical protein